ncbi:MAG: DUF1801 domain-containing protein [Actinomycetota bacterium]|nr:DUF1801 domain-containing protein [Actinomycetota bacterium]
MPDLDALLADHSDAVAAVVQRLRSALLDGHPDLRERVRPGWHSVNYSDPALGFLCAVVAKDDWVQLLFEHGALLTDPRRRLSGTGRQVRFLEFSEDSDVDPAVANDFLDLALSERAARRARRPRTSRAG